MSNEYVTVKNRITRRVGQVRRLVAERNPNLEIVPAGTKSFTPLVNLVAGNTPVIEVPVEEEPIDEYDMEVEDA